MDNGAGPGKYAVELAKLGYRMTPLTGFDAELRWTRRQKESCGIRGPGSV
ncbi:hypothetical protein VQ056_00875 [Paenibacillus sp. JTLBN-2024]